MTDVGSASNPTASPTAGEGARAILSNAALELLLMAAVMFITVGAIRFVFAGNWQVPRVQPRVGLAIVGAIVGLTLFLLIRSPWGRKSGGHMNPVITVALWAMGAFPGRAVAPYLVAQGIGAFAGTALARVLLGPAVAEVRYGAVAAAPAWTAPMVFVAEAAGGAAFAALAGLFLTHPKRSRWLPLAVALAVAVLIVIFGPLSGGAVNPARQLGPAILGMSCRFLWIYLIAPLFGGLVGATAHTLLRSRPLLTHRLCGSAGEQSSVPGNEAT